MSLILDALNKSERDRAGVDQPPGLGSEPPATAASEQPGWRRWLWPGLALLFALLAAYLGFDTSQSVESAVSATQVQSAPEPALESPSSQVLATPPQSVAPVRATAPVAAPVVAGVEVAALYAETPTQGQAAAAATVPEPVNPPAQPEPAPVAVAAEPAPLDVEAIAAAAQAELQTRRSEAAPVVEHAAPFIADLRQSQKDEIPTLFYSQHRWGPSAREREVVLNGEVRREGDLVKPGLRLVEVLEDSIVLDYRGTEFRLRSLNSWVNL